jgi:cytochrome c2
LKRSASPWLRATIASVTLLLLVFAIACRSAGDRAVEDARLRVGGDPLRGATLIQHYGCGGCHRIPGVAGAAGRSAPSLKDLAQEAYITGNLPNTPENVMRWIRAPRSILPQTRMPDLGVGPAEARDITTYLWSLR